MLVNSGAFEMKDLMENELAEITEAIDFRDRCDASRAVGKPGLLNDDVNARRDLFTNRSRGQVETGHHAERFHALQRFLGAVRVCGRHGALVACVHGLKHVDRLTAAALTDHDSIRPHAKRILEKISNAVGTAALDIRGLGFERHHVRLVEL